MKLLIDMNLSPRWVDALTEAGIEAVHWIDIGRPTDSDEIILDWAMSQNYVVFTNDLDFGAILAATHAQGPSVIQIRSQDLMPEKLAPRLVAAINQFASELIAGALITVDEKRLKARILPIHRD